MIEQLEFGVYPEWLALPVDQPADALVADIVARFAGDPKPADVKQTVAEGLASLRSQVVDAAGDQLQVFTVWVLLPLGGELLSPRAAAFGAVAAIERGTTPMELVESLIGDAPLHQPVDLQELATPMGPAHVMRARTFATTEHGINLSETTTVAWLPDDDDIAIVLTTLPVDDLVLASDASSALVGLAETATSAAPAS
ncbi:hypothetical protein [Aeromicrobium fastidiosum]|uniref:Uncharacterized protein n=1 Tax=Aeromicrobium fastidiosum TaxID=52699 RepID=A0A641APH2_9ACTN|nr:hypothetical protein [Aeromicrobium fastidiosum]KAA1378297.1 hypothetical protein ESP62_007940 [Aeromicrobium fastidiosum]MBP2388883.1 hypothetical protein [Aeromicrobium fastidiosum]